MSLARFNTQFTLKLIKRQRFYSTASLNIEDEYTETPQYPKILDLSPCEIKKREHQAYYDTIKAVKTIEEKQIKLNMPKYYGFHCYMFYEDSIPYNNLDLVRYLTKTHLIVSDELSHTHNSVAANIDMESLKRDVEDALLVCYCGHRHSSSIQGMELSQKESDNMLSSIVSQQIHRAIMMNLSSNYPHLKATQMDLDPRIESFWFAGGMPLAFELKNVQYGVQDKAIQYIGQPLLTMRSEVPLVPVMPMSECESANFHVPCFEYSPHVAGIFVDRRRTVNTPGFWPGDPYQFGLVSYHRRGHLVDRIYSDPQDHQEALHRQGILASFSWLNAQANFLGFTTYNDITYPLITQSVITNGKFWSFYVYQFNTMLMHLKHIDENMKKNICWATKELKLFEDIKDEKVIGLNENVLKMLVSFYTNIPQDRTGIELRPFVSKEEKVIADYEDDDKRQWLEREYKFITSNRPRFLLPYEIYHWEKIYKIDHKTRPMDARRRPFELGIDPWKRTYDDRQPNYIPRKLRPDVKRHIGRYKKEYFP